MDLERPWEFVQSARKFVTVLGQVVELRVKVRRPPGCCGGGVRSIGPCRWELVSGSLERNLSILLVQLCRHSSTEDPATHAHLIVPYLSTQDRSRMPPQPLPFASPPCPRAEC